MATDPAFWQGRRVFLTGHTGFKGSWAAIWLTGIGAEVTGFALAPDAEPNLHTILGDVGVHSVIGDLRDSDAVKQAVATSDPDIVLHMAAQPLVRYSYDYPVETFASNVQGTVNLLDAVIRQGRAALTLVITTDKVYENDDTGRAFREDDPLGGHDPYAASKAAAEIAVQSYRRSFFAPNGRKLVTARGGNVIGGGDFSTDRLIPDIIRSVRSGEMLKLRSPDATRPWQHVLDCLDGYFTFVQALATDVDLPQAINIGPHDPTDAMSVAEVANTMAAALGSNAGWDLDAGDHRHEMATLALDPSAARENLGWQGRLRSKTAIRLTADWYAAWANGADMTRFTRDQITAYQAG
ncbi:MAG: CDP-glucose 4,6-dehydratase [Pseudomonadota bacterium]